MNNTFQDIAFPAISMSFLPLPPPRITTTSSDYYNSNINNPRTTADQAMAFLASIDASSPIPRSPFPSTSRVISLSSIASNNRVLPQIEKAHPQVGQPPTPPGGEAASASVQDDPSSRLYSTSFPSSSISTTNMLASNGDNAPPPLTIAPHEMHVHPLDWRGSPHFIIQDLDYPLEGYQQLSGKAGETMNMQATRCEDNPNSIMDSSTLLNTGNTDSHAQVFDAHVQIKNLVPELGTAAAIANANMTTMASKNENFDEDEDEDDVDLEGEDDDGEDDGEDDEENSDMQNGTSTSRTGISQSERDARKMYEIRRRNNVSSGFGKLRKLVPGCAYQTGHPLPRTMILSKAAAYMGDLTLYIQNLRGAIANKDEMIRKLSYESMGGNSQKYNHILEMLQNEAEALDSINPDLKWSKLNTASSNSNLNSGTDEHDTSRVSTAERSTKIPLLLPPVRPSTSASTSHPSSSTFTSISASAVGESSFNLNHTKDFGKQLTIAELSGDFNLKENETTSKKKKGGMDRLKLPHTKYFPVEPTVLAENMNVSSSSSNISRPSTAIPTSSSNHAAFGQHLDITSRSTSLPIAAPGTVECTGPTARDTGVPMYNSVPLSSVYNVPVVATPALPPIFSTYYPPASTSMGSRTISSSSSTTSGFATTLTMTESENTGASSSNGELTPPGDDGRRIDFPMAVGVNAITAPSLNRSITFDTINQHTTTSHNKKRRPRLQQQPRYSQNMLSHQNAAMMQASPNLTTTRRLSIINTTERRGSLGHSSDHSLPLPSASSMANDTPSSATSVSHFSSFPFSTTSTVSDGQISPKYQRDSTTSMQGHIIIPSTNTWRIDKTSLRRSKRSASNAAAKAIQMQAIQLQALKTGKDAFGPTNVPTPTPTKELGMSASQPTVSSDIVADAPEAQTNNVTTNSQKKTRPVSRGKSATKRNLSNGSGRAGVPVASESPLLAVTSTQAAPSSDSPVERTVETHTPAIQQYQQVPVMLASGYTGMPASAHGYSYYPPAPTITTHANNVKTLPKTSSSSPYEDDYLLPAMGSSHQYAQGPAQAQTRSGNQNHNQQLASLGRYSQSSVSYPMQYQQAQVPAAVAAYGENTAYATNNYSGSSLYSQWQDSLINSASTLPSLPNYGGNNIVPTPYLQPKRTLHHNLRQQQQHNEQFQPQQIQQQQQGNYTYAYQLDPLTTTMSMNNASVSPAQDAQQWRSYLDDEYLQQLIYPQSHSYEQSQASPAQLLAYDVNGSSDLTSSGHHASDEQGRLKRMRL